METKPVILVVTDDKKSEALDFIGDFNNVNKKDVYTATDDDEAMALFDQHEPRLMLISYENLERAERFYLGLFKNSEKVHIIPHKTILLCKATEANHAYDLCDRDIFDDYVIYKPPYDGNRLRLSVHQALAKIDLEADAGGMYTKISRFGKVTDNLGSLMNEAINEGNKVRDRSLQTYTDIEGVIARELELFGKRLADQEFNDVVEVRDVNALEERLAQFRKERIEPELKQMQTDISHSMNEWTGDFESEFRNHEESINELHELINSIPKSILIVDDDEMYSNILYKILESDGYKVSRANDGIKGLGMIARTKPDLVLMDFEMPGMNGIEVMKRLKEISSLKNIPVIMLTGLSDKKTVQDAVKSGAIDFIVKPVERAVLLEKIAVRLG